MGMKFRISEL